MLKRERQLADEDEIEMTLEEKKLEEEERRLQRISDEFGKVKQSHRDEIDRLNDQRKNQRQSNELEIERQ